MYISGHVDILKKVLQGNDMMRQIKASQLLFVKPQLLWKGLKYPDFPCGEYEFHDGKMKITKRLCTLFKMADEIAFVPEVYSLSFSSHYGLFSIWHSMTFDPTKTVVEVRNEIVDHLLTLCKLSLRDTSLENPGPNIFWLGMVIHTIMDSYSPAHMLRSNTIKDIDYQHLIHEYLPKHHLVVKPDMKQYLSIIKDLKSRVSSIARILEAGDEEKLQQIVDEVSKKYNIKKDKSVKHLAQLTKFFYFHSNKLESFKRQKPVALKMSYDVKIPYTTHPIINFYYYPDQKGFFHKKNDLLSFCKSYGLYNDCVEDVRYIMNNYLETLQQLKNTPNDDKAINSFLKKTYKYFMKRTFRIEASCKKLSSGFDIVEYRRKHRVKPNKTR
jgi:hypothetical protein